MGKFNTKKKNLSDKVNKKKVARKITDNPFEIHINKQKYDIIGRKTKNDRGLPGVSKSKAVKKRKGTLLQEFKLQNKSNRFHDKRIGEKNVGMSQEERQMARFTAERMKLFNKKSKFNLADEILTHKGHTLNEIEKFEEEMSSGDSDDEGMGRLGAKFVEEAHFGGGVLKKTGTDGALSHKELINQLIAESKKRKAERQKDKDQTCELTAKLDSDWKDLLPIVNQSKRNAEDEAKASTENEAKTNEDYDKLMRELQFEARGQPSDRLKSVEEIAKEEKDRLEKLEQDRLNRMKGYIGDSNSKQKHRSADDLDDGYAVDSNLEEVEEDALAYGEDGLPNKEITGGIIKVGENSEESEAESEEEDGGSGDETEDGSEDDSLSDLKASSSDSEDDENQSADEEDKDASFQELSASEDVEEVVKMPANEICSTSTVEVNESIVPNAPQVKKISNASVKDSALGNRKKVKSKTVHKSEESQLRTESKRVEEIKSDLMERKAIMDKARQELPYTFALPETQSGLEELLQKYQPHEQSIVLERLVKCNHPSLSEGNKEKLSTLFTHLLQYFNNLFMKKHKLDSLRNAFQILQNVMPHLLELAQLNPVPSLLSMVAILKEKYEEYRKKPKEFPSVAILAFFKIIGVLFPTSDYRHQVVTPTYIFISQLLTKCRTRTRYHVTFGLFLVTLVLEFTELSRRFIPSSVCFLHGLVFLGIEKSTVSILKAIPPFKPLSNLLVLNDCCSTAQFEPIMKSEDFVTAKMDDDFKLRALHATFCLIGKMHERLSHLSASTIIFDPILDFLHKLPKYNYPKVLNDKLLETISKLERHKETFKMTPLFFEAKRPKALRLYEPNIEKVFDFKKRRNVSKEKSEKEKLLHKYKREFKGAVREIRRDQAFLGRVQIEQKIQNDVERKEKVKRIYAEANVQQGELKSLSKKKKVKF